MVTANETISSSQPHQNSSQNDKLEVKKENENGQNGVKNEKATNGNGNEIKPKETIVNPDKTTVYTDDILECSNSPSTSISSSDGQPIEAFKMISSSVAARRLIRVPCVAGSPPFTAYGGASSARLILIDAVKRVDLVGILNRDDIVFKIEDIEVSGLLQTDVNRLIDRLCYERDQIAVEILPAGTLTDDICEILCNKQHKELQRIIRDNLYSKTVPCELE
ncbi:hypothetical protein WR25_11981 [Diploscapter pachys]|uniref:PDZ domain-containing protein n=1 Tax=Diploscapter pachys TaxID=2018661 RepID=A0A2A2KWN5_9BILA|nr:hypothetical protein WR25_11981 [Diploscapter pachys]